MKNEPSYYAIIPADVRYDNKLTLLARMLYGEITALCNKNGYCWATNKYFGKLYGKSATTISTATNQLKKNNYIRIEIIKNHKRRIYINLKGVKRKLNTPPLRKLNTNNNTSNNNNITSVNARMDKTSVPSIAVKYPRKDYLLVLNAFEICKGVELHGPEVLQHFRAIKTMFKSNRKPTEIISFMKWLRDNENNVKTPWVKLWTIWTVQKKIAEFLAGKLEISTKGEPELL